MPLVYNGEFSIGILIPLVYKVYLGIMHVVCNGHSSMGNLMILSIIVFFSRANLMPLVYIGHSSIDNLMCLVYNGQSCIGNLVPACYNGKCISNIYRPESMMFHTVITFLSTA